ncbi:DUF192 domain-containing protein [Dermatobacter hominis]|uniref:DUF192 domain-containing protein n=1 Tax=Dermatobacter hominis TaxID=2884263 RepID=UPI001D12B709|nr:DUF192 domain-containing protein [Dermatobacter hominis]UDY37722.1 DUF192 domain-containing protein [Dermatobacter hominis]
MPWLVRNGDVLASVETADTRAARRRGLLGRDRVDGVLRLRARSVHTFGMRVPIDVATCIPQGRDGYRVVRVLTMPPRRVSRPAWRARVVLEAEAGSFRRWDVRPGDKLEVR